jgi:hypothetical protein
MSLMPDRLFVDTTRMSERPRLRFWIASAAALVAALAVLLGPGLSTGRAGSAARSTVPAPGSFRQTDFAADPLWEGRKNRSGTRCTKRAFSFGWSGTTAASSTPGEIGGRFARTSSIRAYYAQPLPVTKTLDDSLTVSGTVRVPSPNGGGALLGWFNTATSYDWRTPDFLGIRIDGAGSGARLYAEYGTANTFASAGLGDTGIKLEPRRRYDFTLDYGPDQGDAGAGLLQLTVVGPDGASGTARISLPAAHRADGATFDRFGLLNVQLDGRPMTAYVANLVVDAAAIDLSSPPPWEGVNTGLADAVDCVVHNRQDFGYSNSGYAGGGGGEIGGVVWRSTKRASYYADPVADLTLQDTLYAEGRIDLESAAPDSDLFIGWFDTSSVVSSSTGSTPTNLLAAQLGGPSTWGFRLFPVYHATASIRGGLGNSAMSTAPMLTPKHHPWEWWICYRPNGDLSGNGRVTVGLVDPAGQRPTAQATIAVSAQAKATGARFNRFGIRTLEQGGHDVVAYLDDLRYTAGPGDVGPDDRC